MEKRFPRKTCPTCNGYFPIRKFMVKDSKKLLKSCPDCMVQEYPNIRDQVRWECPPKTYEDNVRNIHEYKASKIAEKE